MSGAMMIISDICRFSACLKRLIKNGYRFLNFIKDDRGYMMNEINRRFQYKKYDINNKNCIHVVLSSRAYASIISEVLSNNQNETGGVLIGNVYNRVWYIVDAIDPGMDTVNQTDFFRWDADYVNHLAQRNGALYRYPTTILGFWHRHPGRMDFFSGTDEKTIRNNLRESRIGLLSMLVNIDPELRMTFYYCNENQLMQVRYDYGDEYFPKELLEYASPEQMAERVGTVYAKSVKVKKNRVLRPEQMPSSIEERKPKTVTPEEMLSAEHPETTVPAKAAEITNYDVKMLRDFIRTVVEEVLKEKEIKKKAIKEAEAPEKGGENGKKAEIAEEGGEEVRREEIPKEGGDETKEITDPFRFRTEPEDGTVENSENEEVQEENLYE